MGWFANPWDKRAVRLVPLVARSAASLTSNQIARRDLASAKYVKSAAYQRRTAAKAALKAGKVTPMKIPQTTTATATPALLDGLPEADRKAVLSAAACDDLPARTVVCRQAEPADRMFLIRTGRVRLARSTTDGRDVLLRWLGPGECFGLGTLVSGPARYVGTALTMDRVCLFAWKAAAIRRFATTQPQLALNALRIALSYLDEFAERHSDLLSRSAEQRVARTLTHLAATQGRLQPTGVELDITNSDLASLADVSMFTVSRQLKRWERNGHLRKTRQHVLIRHPEALLEA